MWRLNEYGVRYLWHYLETVLVGADIESHFDADEDDSQFFRGDQCCTMHQRNLSPPAHGQAATETNPHDRSEDTFKPGRTQAGLRYDRG